MKNTIYDLTFFWKKFKVKINPIYYALAMKYETS